MQKGEAPAEAIKRQEAEEAERIYRGSGDGKRPPLAEAPEHIRERIQQQARENVEARGRARLKRVFGDDAS